MDNLIFWIWQRRSEGCARVCSISQFLPGFELAIDILTELQPAALTPRPLPCIFNFLADEEDQSKYCLELDNAQQEELDQLTKNK